MRYFLFPDLETQAKILIRRINVIGKIVFHHHDKFVFFLQAVIFSCKKKKDFDTICLCSFTFQAAIDQVEYHIAY